MLSVYLAALDLRCLAAHGTFHCSICSGHVGSFVLAGLGLGCLWCMWDLSFVGIRTTNLLEGG